MSNTQARTEFASAINQICAERGIEPAVVIDTIKTAILAAYRKEFGIAEEVNYDVTIDPETGSATIFEIKADDKRVDVTPPGFGRIAAQTAKQVILQKVREAEKDAVIQEYQDKVGTMITGMVLRYDGKNVIYDIGRGQAYMPPEEQIPTEFYKMNQRMAVFIKDIRETMRGKTIIVSRATENLVTELFRREVPEVGSGAVTIKAIAREAGHRTKIAVESSQEGVDPVGSCVGQKGIRVQEVISELNNEKIDIIQFSDNPKNFITAALAPAENIQVEINEKKKKAVVTVPDDQLSLAIGRGGQNVRLAAKLTGFKIDIKGTTTKGTVSVTGKEEYEIDQLDLDPAVREIFIGAKVTTFDTIMIKKDQLLNLEGITPAIIEEIIAQIKDFTLSLDKMTRREVVFKPAVQPEKPQVAADETPAVTEAEMKAMPEEKPIKVPIYPKTKTEIAAEAKPADPDPKAE